MVGNFDLILVALFTIVGISTRFIGAFVGMVLAKAPKSQRWPVAAFHTPGGEMHIVIGALALELSLISQSVFVAIVVAAVLSSVILGPWVTLIMKKMVPASILKILSSHSVELISDTKYDALKELCIVASENSGVDLEVLYGAARSRDEAMSTALENGIAIPHARLSELKEPVVVFGRSRAGIDWDAPDGIPARIIFLICTPLDKADLQLNIYSQIVKVLSDKELFTTLENAPSVDSAAIALNDGLRRLYFTQ
jgi:mannitol/fructose-specific phosphotransferase system IIA component (Ntr-type)